MSYYGIKKDSATNASVGIDYVHHEIHDGDYFTYADVLTSLGSGSIVQYVLKTPNTTRWPHFGHTAESIGPISVEIYKSSGSDFSGSSLQIAYNSNENSVILPTMQIYKVSGSDVSGSRIYWKRGGIDNNKQTIGSQVGTSTEIILKQNQFYVYQLTSYMASNLVSIEFSWYEHTNLV